MGIMGLDAAMDFARLEMGRRMLRAAVHIQTTHMERVSKPNKRVPRTGTFRRARPLAEGVFGPADPGTDRGVEWLDNSKPGEYPRLRTAHGRAGVVYGPTTAEEVAAAGKIRIGHSQASKYMLILELRKDPAKRRLGYQETAKTERGRAIALLTGKAM